MIITPRRPRRKYPWRALTVTRLTDLRIYETSLIFTRNGTELSIGGTARRLETVAAWDRPSRRAARRARKRGR